ncbi:hypothetical protein FB451DRAFT_443567 [Mycena latifolia]|nr:hypothetical protein FB451DRAFT_443567 [Mycena latifolia]
MGTVRGFRVVWPECCARVAACVRVRCRSSASRRGDTPVAGDFDAPRASYFRLHIYPASSLAPGCLRYRCGEPRGVPALWSASCAPALRSSLRCSVGCPARGPRLPSVRPCFVLRPSLVPCALFSAAGPCTGSLPSKLSSRAARCVPRLGAARFYCDPRALAFRVHPPSCAVCACGAVVCKPPARVAAPRYMYGQAPRWCARVVWPALARCP